MARVHWLICGRFGGKPTLPGGYSKIGGPKLSGQGSRIIGGSGHMFGQV